MHTVTKKYRDFPAAHRQPRHAGHCRLIHGHNWGFDIVFTCQQLDDNGFVIDVGTLGDIKAFLTDKFDHTLLLNSDDPELKHLNGGLGGQEVIVGKPGEETVTIDRPPLAKIVVVPNCGMEGLARYVFAWVDDWIDNSSADNRMRELQVTSVTCWEDSKNAATYHPASFPS